MPTQLHGVLASAVEVATTSPLLVVACVVVIVTVIVVPTLAICLMILSLFAQRSVRLEKQSMLEKSLADTRADMAALVGMATSALALDSRNAPEPQKQPPTDVRRYFYVSYDIVIDHDRNIEEFGVPGLEVIRRGTIHRPCNLVFVALDGVHRPVSCA
jgi:hypothetical protein